MKRIINLLKGEFESSIRTTPEFKSFAIKFKNSFKKELEKIGATLTDFNRGHFYVSGFFRLENGNCYYFSISDVRFFKSTKLMYRTAMNEKDYTGGWNHYVEIDDDMIYEMKLN